MDLIQFCRLKGIQITSLPPIGVWRRYKTDDHPQKRNGAVKYMGDHAFVQNHALETSVSVWRGVNVYADRRMIDAAVRRAEEKTVRDQARAADRAKWILSQAQVMEHPYLEAKGFKTKGFVWKDLLVIPMYVRSRMVGAQMIQPDGQKRFLSGQQTSEAEFRMEKGGIHILCEGYATGLAIREALQALRMPYVIHVTFSAQNMLKVSRMVPAGVVVADNDASKTGERVAQQIGWPYWISEVEGEDAHDAWRRVGTFRLSQALRSVLMGRAKKRADLNVVGG